MIPKIFVKIGERKLSHELIHLIPCTEKLFNIVDIDYTPTKGDKLYLLPGVELPRAKLKAFNDEYGTKNVRDANTADYIFGSSKTQYEYFTNNGTGWYYSISKSDFDKVEPYLHSYFQIDPTDISDLKNVIDAHITLYGEEEFRIYYSWNTVNELRDLINKKKLNLADTYDNSNSFYTVHNDFIEEVELLQTKTIYDISGLIAAISSKNVIIDYEMFGQLKNMFESNDKDNHVLAMEIMANSNIVESLLFLEMLFKEHSYTMYECHTRNHVNFKSLCSMMNKNKYRYTTDLDDVVKSLISFNVLTADKLNLLMRHYNNEINQRGNTEYFKVKTVTVSDKVLQLLNQNYTYGIIEDFEPVVVEEETVEEEVVNTESLNIESVTEEVTEEIIEEEVSFQLEDVNAISESEETVRVIETVREEELLPFVEDTTEAITDTEEELDINPTTTEENGESEIDWF